MRFLAAMERGAQLKGGIAVEYRGMSFPWGTYFQYGLASFFVVTLFFSIFTSIDLDIARILYVGAGEFYFDHSSYGPFLRDIFRGTFILACFIAAAGLVYSLSKKGRQNGMSPAKWIFLGLCLAVGPGVVANLTLKSNWERARPVHLQEFGGTKHFSPPLIVSDQCHNGNCAFVSGEASNMYTLFFALALMTGGGIARRRLILLGIVAGMAAGAVRMLQGGHFLSDVIFAGVFMWLTVVALAWLVFAFWPERYRYLQKVWLIVLFKTT